MKNIYLDNAATTQLRTEVINEMIAVLQNSFGNPSSSHSFGRSAKSILETSRKLISKILGCTAQEIIFTANATEATNWILKNAVENLNVSRIITSKIEHHATLYMVLELQKTKNITVDYVAVLPNGQLDINDLVNLLSKSNEHTLVSLMHVNNEIGTVLDIEKVGRICKQHNALFHCDAVQSIGKEQFNLNEIDVDFVVASAHKFHGPKGIGFAYIKKGNHMLPFIFGGEQEKGLRAGTEALHQIAGMTKALQMANENFESEKKYILSLKEYCIEQLSIYFKDYKINGETTFYNILNVCLPISPEQTPLILFALDMKGISVSRGSACQSGSPKPSHVLTEFLSATDLKKPNLRISFSHYNTTADIDALIAALKTV